MKKAFLAILAVALFCVFACEEIKSDLQPVGAPYTITLEPGQKLVSASIESETAKYYPRVSYLTRPMRKDEVPEEYTLVMVDNDTSYFTIGYKRTIKIVEKAVKAEIEFP